MKTIEIAPLGGDRHLPSRGIDAREAVRCDRNRQRLELHEGAVARIGQIDGGRIEKHTAGINLVGSLGIFPDSVILDHRPGKRIRALLHRFKTLAGEIDRATRIQRCDRRFAATAERTFCAARTLALTLYSADGTCHRILCDASMHANQRGLAGNRRRRSRAAASVCSGPMAMMVTGFFDRSIRSMIAPRRRYGSCPHSPIACTSQPMPAGRRCRHFHLLPGQWEYRCGRQR